ncbi:hypothetical protein N9Y81_04225 [Akkermansiaceae bacterium]|nr:hypothetical protein [Akkermansiaceae bacterium]
MTNIGKFIKASFLVVSWMTFTSCTSFTNREYRPFIRNIDGESELHISTYPAFFPKKKSTSNSIVKKLESHAEVYFQLSIRDLNKRLGPNPHIESVTIHSFSYQLPNEPKIEILTDYHGSFWMQGNPNYESSKLPAIPYRPDSTLSIEINFNLNGKTYSYEGEMKARESTIALPTAIANRSI